MTGLAIVNDSWLWCNHIFYGARVCVVRRLSLLMNAFFFLLFISNSMIHIFLFVSIFFHIFICGWCCSLLSCAFDEQNYRLNPIYLIIWLHESHRGSKKNPTWKCCCCIQQQQQWWPPSLQPLLPLLLVCHCRALRSWIKSKFMR